MNFGCNNGVEGGAMTGASWLPRGCSLDADKTSCVAFGAHHRNHLQQFTTTEQDVLKTALMNIPCRPGNNRVNQGSCKCD